MNAIRFLAVTFVSCGLGLVVVGSACAVPKPPPRFWSPTRCERVMLARPLAPPRQVICVGGGEQSACRWTSGHRARLYSEFTVFARYRQAHVDGPGFGSLDPGVVRSFTLATRVRLGFARIVHHWGDQYAGWPADFFKGHVRLLATHATPARFRSIVAPITARLMQAKPTDCTGVQHPAVRG